MLKIFKSVNCNIKQSLNKLENQQASSDYQIVNKWRLFLKNQ